MVVGWSSSARVSSVVPVLSAVPVSSAGLKKKAFDRGGPVWLPRSNAADDRLGGVVLGFAKNRGGQRGSAPQPNRKSFRKIEHKNWQKY